MASVSANPDLIVPDVSRFVTEDDTPVDNFIPEKQQRLLTETLYASWGGPPTEAGEEPRPFLAAANVGYYATIYDENAIVPDVMISADVELPPDWIEAKRKCYMLWQFGKPPDLALEIVSNEEGDELGLKLRRYARLRVPYYTVFDPMHCLGDTTLHGFELHGNIYRRLKEPVFSLLGLRLELWTGSFERCHTTWLRWVDHAGRLLLTGAERAEEQRQRAEEQRQRAEEQRQRAESAEQELVRLREMLRAAGIDPEAPQR